MNHRQLDTPPSVEIQPTHDDVSNSRRIEWDGWNDRALRGTMEKMAISQTNGTKEGGGDTCGLEVGIARFRSETETGIGGMPLE